MVQIHAWRIGMLTGPEVSGQDARRDRRHVGMAGRHGPRPSRLGIFVGTVAGIAGSRCSTARPRRWLALGPVGLRRNRGVPRRTAPQWNALARLVEPLDEALAGLHHGEHVRYRRAGAHAAGAVLQHCADSGRQLVGLGAVGVGAVVRDQRRASSSPRRRRRPSRRCGRTSWLWPTCSAGSPTSTGWARSIGFTWPA